MWQLPASSSSYYSVPWIIRYKNVYSNFNNISYELISDNNPTRTGCITDSFYPYMIVQDPNNAMIVSLGVNNYPTVMTGLLLGDKTYEFDNDTILIYTNSIMQSGPYKTELYRNERVLNGKIKQQFTDVCIYDKSQEKIIKNLSTYYGDGTQWIKIKN